MKEEEYLKNRMGRENPFRVPEGYFDSLTARVMSSLPESESKVVPIRRSLTSRLRPLLYMAASLFIAIAGFTIYKLAPEPDGRQGQAVVAQESASQRDYFEEAADYAMVDNIEIYACLTTE